MLFSGRVHSYEDAFFNAFQQVSVGHYLRYLRNSEKRLLRLPAELARLVVSLTPLVNMDSPYIFPMCYPQLTDSATLSAQFVKFTYLTTLVKWTILTFPTCHPSTNGLGHTQRTWTLDILTRQNLRTETRSKQQQFR